MWLEDLIPAYASLAVVLRIDALEARWQARDWLVACVESPPPPAEPNADPVDIPVLYGGDAGPDLPAAAEALGLPVEELIQRHANGDYLVAMLGFAPGFPYLLGLDSALAMPRLDSPRTSVPAGSVGIGGSQTGVYPRAGAGGWRLLGRTPLQLFDAGRERPALLQPGDRVRFVPIDAGRFAALARSSGRHRCGLR
jgi:KipI family sensor histidine kinase inhibitor